jgi:Coenzyme PQQ synthesis protein D (PqqD)
MGADYVNTKCYVTRSSAVAARVLGDEMMVMSATDSTLFTLDEVATVIWEAADGATSLEEIVMAKVCAQYEITPEVALKDAESFVRGLAEYGLLQISEQPISAAASLS